MKETTCCIMGCRKAPEVQLQNIKLALHRAVVEARIDGYSRFLFNLALEWDRLFASSVLEEAKHDPRIFLEAVVPYAGFLQREGKAYRDLLQNCHGIKILCQSFSPSGNLQCSRYMVESSQRILIVCAEENTNHYAYAYAHLLQREVFEIKI